MKKIGIVFIVLLASFSSFLAQAGIDGPVIVCAGSTQTYFAVLDPGMSVDRWIVVGGSISGSINSSSVIIIWSGQSGGTLTLRKKDANRDTFIEDISVSFYTGGTAVSSNSSVCGGSSITLSVNGNHNVISYWQLSSDGGTSWGNIPGSASDPFTYTSIGGPSVFRAVSADCSPSQISSSVSVGIIPNSGGGVLSGGGTFCFGQNTNIVLSSYTPETIFRWWRKIGAGSWEIMGVPNKDDPNQSVQANVTTTYRAETSGNCANQFSNEVTVSILPIPTMTASDAIICSGSSINVPLINTNAVAGTTFSWTQTSSNVSGAAAGTGNVINQTLTNNLHGLPGTVTYTITPISGAGCIGSSINVVVTVNPIPIVVVSIASQSICTSQPMTSITITNPNEVSGTTFSWTVSAPSITGATSGSGTVISQTLVNTTNANQTAVYYIIPTANGCAGAPVAHTVTVKPTPSASVSLASQLICSGQPMTSVTITNPNLVSGTTFGWTVSATNITGATAGSGATLSQTLANTTNVNQTAVYTITPTANGCAGAPVTHTVTVQPDLNAGSISGTQAICYNTNVPVFGSVVASGGNGTYTYQWQSRPPAGSWTNISGATTAVYDHTTLGTTTEFKRVVTSCGATKESNIITVSIKPTPTISASNQTLCSGQSTTITITNPNNVPGTTFTWTASPTNVTGSSGGSDSPIAQPLTSSTGGSVTYSITPSANGCQGAPINVVATVNALPAAPSVSARNRFDAGPFTLTASGAPGGGSYNWYNPANSLLQGNSATYVTPTVSTSTSNYAYARTVSSSGCLSSGSTWASLVMETPPVVTGGNRIVMGANVTLDAGAGFVTYDWRNSSNTTVGSARTFSTNVTGDYTVRVTKAGVDGTGASPAFSVLPQLSGHNENYIITNAIQVNNITDPAQILNLPAESNSQTIQYFDGLGRPMQTVSTQGSPAKLDIVTPVVYDAFGRESKKYLPFVAQNNGWYKPNEQIIDFATGNYLGIAQPAYSNTSDKIADDLRPYSETVFEPSPLNRPDKDFGAGKEWYDNNRHVKHDYLINVHGTAASQERVIAWKVDPNGMPVRAAVVAGYVETGGYYSNGQLTIKSTKDEQGNEVREYVDKEGRTILKKVQVVGGIAQTNNDTHWAMTYYIYDDMGNLAVVLPPEAVKAITAQ